MGKDHQQLSQNLLHKEMTGRQRCTGTVSVLDCPLRSVCCGMSGTQPSLAPYLH